MPRRRRPSIESGGTRGSSSRAPCRRVPRARKGPRHVCRAGREMTFPLHPRLERIWNGEAGKGEQAERLARAAPGLTKQDLGRVATYGEPRADLASRRSRTVMVGTFPGSIPGAPIGRRIAKPVCLGYGRVCAGTVANARVSAPLKNRPPDRAAIAAPPRVQAQALVRSAWSTCSRGAIFGPLPGHIWHAA